MTSSNPSTSLSQSKRTNPSVIFFSQRSALPSLRLQAEHRLIYERPSSAHRLGALIIRKAEICPRMLPRMAFVVANAENAFVDDGDEVRVDDLQEMVVGVELGSCEDEPEVAGYAARLVDVVGLVC